MRIFFAFLLTLFLLCSYSPPLPSGEGNDRRHRISVGGGEAVPRRAHGGVRLGRPLRSRASLEGAASAGPRGPTRPTPRPLRAGRADALGFRQRGSQAVGLGAVEIASPERGRREIRGAPEPAPFFCRPEPASSRRPVPSLFDIDRTLALEPGGFRAPSSERLAVKLL